MSEQTVTILLSGLILIINGFLFFWLNSVRQDVRDLRGEYLSAVTDALKTNADLRVEVKSLEGTISVLKTEILYLKEFMTKLEPVIKHKG